MANNPKIKYTIQTIKRIHHLFCFLLAKTILSFNCVNLLFLRLLAIFLDQKKVYLMMGYFEIVISVTDIIILSIINKKLTAATNAFANELKSESTSNSINQ